MPQLPFWYLPDVSFDSFFILYYTHPKTKQRWNFIWFLPTRFFHGIRCKEVHLHVIHAGKSTQNNFLLWQSIAKKIKICVLEGQHSGHKILKNN